MYTVTLCSIQFNSMYSYPVQHSVLQHVHSYPVQHSVLQHVHSYPVHHSVLQHVHSYPVQHSVLQHVRSYPVQHSVLQHVRSYPVQHSVLQHVHSYPDLWPLARSAFTQAEEGKYIHLVKQRMPKQSTLFHCICKITYFIVIDGHQQSCVGCNWQLQAEFHRWVCCCCCCCFNMDMTVLSDDFLIFLKNLQ